MRCAECATPAAIMDDLDEAAMICDCNIHDCERCPLTPEQCQSLDAEVCEP